jgi:hypothetical protein
MTASSDRRRPLALSPFSSFARGELAAGEECSAIDTRTSDEANEDAALVELSDMPMDEPLDNLIVFPADRLDAVWCSGDPPGQEMEA